MIALIDGDIVCYRCAASAENEVEDIAIWRVDDLMHRILRSTGSDEYEAFISGTENFRKRIDPTYKANRTQARPKWYEHCREYLVTRWGSRVGDEVEADDLIGISQSYYFDGGVPSVVCSIDKDLKQLPGKHYNFVKEEFDFVTPLDAHRNFYKQLLIGDRTDNIFGVVGIGKVKAGKIIDPLSDEKDMYEVVKSLYDEEERFNKNCQLLWIMRKENSHFQSPFTRSQEAETPPSS